jgi:hypothetical protein
MYYASALDLNLTPGHDGPCDGQIGGSPVGNFGHIDVSILARVHERKIANDRREVNNQLSVEDSRRHLMN